MSSCLVQRVQKGCSVPNRQPTKEYVCRCRHADVHNISREGYFILQRLSKGTKIQNFKGDTINMFLFVSVLIFQAICSAKSGYVLFMLYINLSALYIYESWGMFPF